MIEVNLHPDGGRARRRSGGRFPISLPTSLPRFGSGDRGERDVWSTVAVVVPLLALLAIGWMWYTQRSERSELQARLDTAVEDSTRLADLRALSDSLTERRTEISQRLELVRSLDDGRFVWPHLMDEVSRALPAYTWLTSMRQSSTEPRLQVQVDGLSANPLAITRFVRNLQSSPYVAEVRILGSQQERVNNVATQAFKLVLAYESPPPSAIRTEPLVESF